MLLTGSERTALRRAVRLLSLNWLAIWRAVGAGFLGLGSSIALTATSAWMIARASQMPHFQVLAVAAVGVRTFGIGRSVMRYLERLASHNVALYGLGALREQVYRRLADSPVEVVASLRRGDVLVRTGADVDEIGDVVLRGFLPVAIGTTVSLGVVILTAFLSPLIALILAACLLISATVGPLLTARAARVTERAMVDARADLTAHALTMVDGGAELAIAGHLDVARGELSRTESHMTRLRDRAATPAAIAAGVDLAAMALAVLGSLAVGTAQLTAGAINPVELAVLVLTPLAAFEATSSFGPAATQVVRSAAAAERVMALLDSASVTAERSADLPEGADTITARGLATRWPGFGDVTRGVDLTVRPGEAIAIVGPSGIGKTTLLATLAGLLPPREGSVSAAGVELAEASREQAARLVSLTAEDAHIFSTTVLENLRVGRGDLTEAQAVSLLQRVGLAGWLRGLPEGVGTMLGADGATVSGGERRRLLLARALAGPAPIVMVDEPAEHLDLPTADALMRDLLSLAHPTDGSAPRGVVVVTHHLGPLADADEVLLLTPGPDGVATVSDRGTHAELMARNELYRSAATEVRA